MIGNLFRKNYLSWCASTKSRPYANFGDALSPIIIQGLMGSPVCIAGFNSNVERIAGIGTILQNFSNGRVHVWGTGLDCRRNILDKQKQYFDPTSTNTEYVIHAVRGRITGNILNSFGLADPEIYGDPGIFIEKLFRSYLNTPIKHSLSVIAHLTDLVEYHPESEVNNELLNLFGHVNNLHYISPIAYPTTKSVLDKVKEIASSSCIISKSLHGMLMAELFKIPCALLSRSVTISGRYSVYDYSQDIDHRFRDLYSGIGKPTILIFNPTNFENKDPEKIISFIKGNWDPVETFNDMQDRLVEAFPYTVKNYNEISISDFGLDKIKL